MPDIYTSNINMSVWKAKQKVSTKSLTIYGDNTLENSITLIDDKISKILSVDKIGCYSFPYVSGVYNDGHSV